MIFLLDVTRNIHVAAQLLSKPMRNMNFFEHVRFCVKYLGRNNPDGSDMQDSDHVQVCEHTHEQPILLPAILMRWVVHE